MIQIRKERPKVELGEYLFKDNPLINSPHTLEMVSSSTWNFSYSREDVAYPVEIIKKAKYWSPLSRVDNVYGDKNFVLVQV